MPSPTSDGQAPATKQDVTLIMQDVALIKRDITLIMEEIGKLYAANAQWKGELEEQISASEERTKLHFDVTAEHITSSLVGANREEIIVLKDTAKKHDQRITHLESLATS